MTLSFVGYATQASGNTVTIPTHQAGDLIIIYASRGNATPPGVGSGFMSMQTMANGSYSYRVGYQIAAAAGTTSGTWTNASRLMVFVYRSTTAFRLPRFVGGWLSSTSRVYDWPAPTSALEDEYLLRHLYSATNVTGNVPPAHTAHVNAGSGANYYQAWMVGTAPITGTAAAYVSPGNVATYIAGQIAVGESPAWPGYEDDFNAETLDPFWEDNSANAGAILGLPAPPEPPALVDGRVELGQADLDTFDLTVSGFVTPTNYAMAVGDTFSFNCGYLDEYGYLMVGLSLTKDSHYVSIMRSADTENADGLFLLIEGMGAQAEVPPADWVRFRVTSGGTLAFESANTFDGSWTLHWESPGTFANSGYPFYLTVSGLGVWVDNFNTAGATPIPAFVGTAPVSAIKVGAADATAVYLGATKLWP